jgi:glycerate-2-kinase
LNPRQYLDRNDSYTFLDRVGGLLRTGPTRTNVGDLQVLFITER